MDDSKHINSYIHKILEIIKSKDEAFKISNIEIILGMSIRSNSLLMKALRNNSKIEISSDSIRYIPSFKISSLEDLIDLLREKVGQEGIELFKLKDSSTNMNKYLEEIKDRIIIIKDMDGTEVVFYNEMKVEEVKEEIRTMWNSVKIPNYHDILDELNTVGLKTNEKQIKKAVIKNKKNKKNKRRIKITNTHVKGLDLSKLTDSE